jgi:transcriptional regulator with XRE-family HTH domain
MIRIDGDAEALTAAIAERVRELRSRADMTLENLAHASGVSRSMLSSIERAEANPTAVVLDRIAAAFGMSLSDLLTLTPQAASPVARRAQQPVWRDAQSSYERITLTPTLPGAPLRLIEVRFPPGARVAFESARGAASAHQQIWMISGRMEISIGAETHELASGDCLVMTPDKPTRFFNPGDKPARYVVAQLT